MTCIALYRYRGSRGLSALRLDRYGAVRAHEYVVCGVSFSFGNMYCMYDILRFRHTIIPPCHDFTNSPGCHVTITSFRQCAIPPFHHGIIVTIARSQHSTTSIPPINQSVNPPFGHSIIPPLVSTSAFHRSAILTHNHFASPTNLIVQKHSNILSFRHLVFSLSLFAVSPLGHLNILPIRESDFAN